MSFLDKLGDFTGGFGEGLSGTILPAFEKGWDRQTKLMDKAENRDYAEGRQAEDRVYNQRLQTINGFIRSQDLVGLNNYVDEEGVGETPELLQVIDSASGTIARSLAGKTTELLGSADVSLERIKLELDGKSFLDYSQEGMSAVQIKNAVNVIDDKKNELISLLSNPSTSQADIERINAKVDNFDTLIQKYHTLSSGYSAWNTSKGDFLSHVGALPEGADVSSMIQKAIDSGTLTKQEGRTLRTVNRNGRFTQLLERGEVEEAQILANSLPTNDPQRGFFEDRIEDVRNGIERSSLEGDISTANLGSSLMPYKSISDFLKSDEAIDSMSRDKIITMKSSLIAGSASVVAREEAKHVDARRKVIIDVDRRLADAGMAFAPTGDPKDYTIYIERINNVLRNTGARDYGIAPWVFDRVDWEETLRMDYQMQGGLGQNYATFLNNSMSFGALTSEEALDQIDSVEWLTVGERDNALKLLNRDPSNMVVHPALRQFDLQSIQDGGEMDPDIYGSGQSYEQFQFSESDTEQIKYRITEAMAGKGPLSVRDTFAKIKIELRGRHQSTANRIHIDNAVEAVINLETAVMGFDPFTGQVEEKDAVPASPKDPTTPTLTEEGYTPGLFPQPPSPKRNNMTKDSLGMTQDYLDGTTSPRKNVRGIGAGAR
tara:strand:- start:174 stop:2150 length:1977 start_codon:yes stop_codon:yes gene_type:complete